MANLNMDLTGENPNCKVSGTLIRVFKSQQKILFNTPVFAESIHIYYASGGLSGRELVLDTDYRIPEEMTDDNSISSAKLIQSSFDKRIVTGVVLEITPPDEDNLIVSVTYQRLYPTQVTNAYINRETIQVTPELMLSIVDDIEALKLRTTKLDSTGSLTNAEAVVLDIDDDCTNPANAITNEEAIVDVPDGKFTIMPKHGAFYYDSVKVRLKATGAELIKDTDYRIIGMDSARTKATKYTQPVYNFIVINASIVGSVLIDYHAYGGQPTIDHYRDLVGDINDIITYINSSSTVTESNLGSTKIITSIVERIYELEEQVRRLNGTPSYGDITSGNATLMKIFGNSGDSELHWYTIASLYTTDGTDMAPSTADTFIFRLQTMYSHFQFKLAVSVDLNNQEGDVLHVDTISDNYPRGFTPFKNYTQIASIIRPQIRVIWNTSTSATGALLQLGFECRGILEETICIEDMSGHESSWKLVEEIKTITSPADDLVQLPDGKTTWSDINPNSHKEEVLIPFTKGHLAWVGNINLNRPVTGWQSYKTEPDEVLLHPATNITRISKLRLDISEEEGFQFPIDISFNTGCSRLKGHASFTHNDKPAYINAEIYREPDEDEETDRIVIKLNYNVTAGLDSNPIAVKDMVVFAQ